MRAISHDLTRFDQDSAYPNLIGRTELVVKPRVFVQLRTWHTHRYDNYVNNEFFEFQLVITFSCIVNMESQ